MTGMKKNVLKLLFVFVLFLGVDAFAQAQVDTTNRNTTTRNNNVGTMNEQQDQQGGNNVDAWTTSLNSKVTLSGAQSDSVRAIMNEYYMGRSAVTDDASDKAQRLNDLRTNTNNRLNTLFQGNSDWNGYRDTWWNNIDNSYNTTGTQHNNGQ